jgi:serine/threonine-protein kinase
VVGQQLDQAQATLQSAGFTVTVNHKDDPTKPANQVLDQNPDGNTGMASATGVTVTITVANGPPVGPMPSVIGMPCPVATAQLAGMGLQVTVNGGDAEKAVGTVGSQSPDPNTPLTAAQPVTITCQIP